MPSLARNTIFFLATQKKVKEGIRIPSKGYAHPSFLRKKYQKILIVLIKSKQQKGVFVLKKQIKNFIKYIVPHNPYPLLHTLYPILWRGKGCIFLGYGVYFFGVLATPFTPKGYQLTPLIFFFKQNWLHTHTPYPERGTGCIFSGYVVYFCGVWGMGYGVWVIKYGVKIVSFWGTGCIWYPLLFVSLFRTKKANKVFARYYVSLVYLLLAHIPSLLLEKSKRRDTYPFEEIRIPSLYQHPKN